MPLLAVGIYLQLYHETGADEATTVSLARSVEDMAADVMRGLQQQTDEGRGWIEQGHAHMADEQFGDAALAFQKAHKLIGDRPDLLVDYAEALALAHGSELTGPPSQLLDRALELAPNHTKALWLAGFAAVQEGDNPLAISRWRQMLTRNDLDVQIRKMVEEQIARVEGGLQAKATTQQTQPTESGARLNVRVTLEPSLVDEAAPEDTVFVFVRAPQGPRAPIAVTRARVKDLPLSFEFDDSMSMVPQLRLSQFPEVLVAARISHSGDAMVRSGDLRGMSGLVDVAAGEPVEITIDQKVP
jgi:cytochrome c-type biogenesis protein CcmH